MRVTEETAPYRDEPPLRGLPLFPLKLVLFPDAVLGLKVFEPRYLDLITDCLRTGQAFGVVCLNQGEEVKRGAVQFESVGTLAHLDEVDADQPGLLMVRAHGGQRFQRSGTPTQQADGLWRTDAYPIDHDALRMPGPTMLPTVEGLAKAIQQIRAQGHEVFREPYRLDESGWVANRWCELLPISLAAKQKLMELDDPTIRLSLVDAYLRDKQVVVG